MRATECGDPFVGDASRYEPVRACALFLFALCGVGGSEREMFCVERFSGEGEREVE